MSLWPHGVVWHKRCDACAAEVLEATPWQRPCPFYVIDPQGLPPHSVVCLGVLRVVPFELAPAPSPAQRAHAEAC